MLNHVFATMLRTGQGAAEVNIEGITHEQSLIEPEPSGNCTNWIVGHMIVWRDNLLAKLGEARFLSESEADPYLRGSVRMTSGDGAVDFDRLREGLSRTAERLCARVERLSDKDMDQPIPAEDFPVPPEEPNLRSYVMLVVGHDQYHIGQLALSRRLCGITEGGIS